MTNAANISARIEDLATEAAAAGDLEMVALCERAEGRALWDSDSIELVTPEDLFGDELPMPAYVRAICESLNHDARDGHVRVAGRSVYAD